MKEFINIVVNRITSICNREDLWVNSGMGEVMRAEEGGSILKFNCDVVRCKLIFRPIATRLGAAVEFGYANDKVLRAETKVSNGTYGIQIIEPLVVAEC